MTPSRTRTRKDDDVDELRNQPEPEPEPVVAKSDVVEEQDTQEDAESEQAAASQTQQVGAKGMAGDPGEGVHQSGDDESDLLKYKAKVRNTIVYNKQYPHRARMRRQQGTVTAGPLHHRRQPVRRA